MTDDEVEARLKVLEAGVVRLASVTASLIQEIENGTAKEAARELLNGLDLKVADAESHEQSDPDVAAKGDTERARGFFIKCAAPFVRDAHSQPGSLRHAYAAAVFLFHTADWHSIDTGRPLKGLIKELETIEPAFPVIGDLANAAKHLKLDDRSRGRPVAVRSAGAATSPYIPFTGTTAHADPFVRETSADRRAELEWWQSSWPAGVQIDGHGQFGPIALKVFRMWRDRLGITR